MATPEEIRRTNAEAASLATTFSDLAKAMKESAKAAAQATGNSAETYKETFGTAIDMAKKLQGITAEELKTVAGQKSLATSLNSILSEKAKISAKIEYLQQRSLTATQAELPFINKALQQLQEVESTIDATVSQTEALQENFEEAEKRSQKIKDNIKGWVTGIESFAKTFVVNGLNEVDERITAIGRSLNRSREESTKLFDSFEATGRALEGLSGKELEKAAMGLSDAMGSTAITSKATANEMASQVKFMGMTAEEANKFAMFTEASGKDAKQLGDNIRGEVLVAEARNKKGIDYKKILKDVANTSNAVKLLIQSQGGSLAKAAIEAKKLGTNMEQIASVGKSMLNFEESLGAELEAELLTGKELNNEKARMYALTGNQEGLAKEITKNQVLQKFEAAKTTLEQEAIAKAYGMTSETMGDMLVQSKALTNMGAKDKTEMNEKIKAQLRLIDAEKDLAKKAEMKAALIKKAGSEELVNQQQNMTRAEHQQEMQDQMVGSLSAIVGILEPIKGIMTSIAHAAQVAAAVLTVIAVGSVAMGLIRLVTNLKGLGGALGGLGGAGGGAGAGGGMLGSMSSINATALLQGAGAMLIAAGAIWVFGKAVQELEKVKDWGNVAMGLGLFAGTMLVLGAAMYFAGPALDIAIPGMLAFGAAALLLGAGVGLAAAGVALFVDSISKLSMDNLAPLMALGPALYSIAGGLGAVAIAGVLAIPAIAGMGVMAIAAPRIVDLAETLGMSQKGQQTTTQGAVTSMDAVVRKLDELIKVTKEGKNLYINQQKLNESTGLSTHRVGDT
jgi:hypothetical protein